MLLNDLKSFLNFFHQYFIFLLHKFCTNFVKFTSIYFLWRSPKWYYCILNFGFHLFISSIYRCNWFLLVCVALVSCFYDNCSKSCQIIPTSGSVQYWHLLIAFLLQIMVFLFFGMTYVFVCFLSWAFYIKRLLILCKSSILANICSFRFSEWILATFCGIWFYWQVSWWAPAMMFGALHSPGDLGLPINPCCCHLWGQKAWATVGWGGAESVGMSLLFHWVESRWMQVSGIWVLLKK